MREITDHVANPANALIAINVIDEPGSGGAHHLYQMAYALLDGTVMRDHIKFQKGPIAEAGVNGVTQEALLAIVIDRLRCFQSGPYACAANAEALRWTEGALDALKKRTLERMNRGVEGTHTV